VTALDPAAVEQMTLYLRECYGLFIEQDDADWRRDALAALAVLTARAEQAGGLSSVDFVRGEQITTAEELDALPDGTVLDCAFVVPDPLRPFDRSAATARSMLLMVSADLLVAARRELRRRDAFRRFATITVRTRPDAPAPTRAPWFVDPAWIGEQRVAGWPDMHPEDWCHRCGRANPSFWYADRRSWLAATSAWAAETGREGICCPSCLPELYTAATGRTATWVLSLDSEAGRSAPECRDCGRSDGGCDREAEPAPVVSAEQVRDHLDAYEEQDGQCVSVAHLRSIGVEVPRG